MATSAQNSTLNTTLPSKVAVFGSRISVGSREAIVDAIFSAAEQRRGAYVCFANVHMLMEADTDPGFQEVLNGADLALPDGAPVALYLNRKHKLQQERLPGMDMLPLLLEEAARRGKSVFFYGGSQQVLDALQARVAENLPTLRVAGAVSPPYRVLTESEDQAYIEQINSSEADLLFVALGCPKQEKWMAARRGRVQPAILGVGQAFMTYAGLEKRLPPWLRKLPVEWLYRLMLEPRRLFKRYAVTNTRFLWKVLWS